MFHRRCLPIPEEFIKNTMETVLLARAIRVVYVTTPVLSKAYDFWEFRVTTLRTAACQRPLGGSQSVSLLV